MTLVLAALVAAGVILVAQPPQDQKVQSAAQRAAERLRALQREADALASQEKTLLAELRKLEIERQIKAEELAAIEADLKETQAQLAATIERAAALREAADTSLPDVEARLVHLYKLGRAGYWRLLLDAGDSRSIGRAYRTASALSAIDRARVQAMYPR